VRESLTVMPMSLTMFVVGNETPFCYTYNTFERKPRTACGIVVLDDIFQPPFQGYYIVKFGFDRSKFRVVFSIDSVHLLL